MKIAICDDEKPQIEYIESILKEWSKTGSISISVSTFSSAESFLFAYIEELDHRLQNVDTLLKTGNVTLDAILSAKISQAKSEHIDVTIKANVPDKLTLTDVELSIIVGNLLDNAIEACRESINSRPAEGKPAMEESAAESPFLRLFIGMKGKMLYFSMLNSAGCKKQKHGSLFSTHKSGIHGFGLERAESILKNHDGWVKYNSEDGAFTSEFLVPAVE